MATFQDLDSKLTIFGPYKGPTGYDEVVRNVVKAFIQKGLRFNLKHFDKWSGVRIDVDPIFEIVEKAQYQTDTLLSFCLPTQSPISESTLNAVYTMFEATRLPKNWVERSWHHDLVMLPNEFCYDVWKQSGVSEDLLRIVPLGIDHSTYNLQTKRIPLMVGEKDIADLHPVRFMAMMEVITRKNYEGLLESWIKAFPTKTNEACLLIKANNNSIHNLGDLYTTLRKLERKFKILHHAPVYIYSNVVPEPFMPGILANATHYLSMSRGEGAELATMRSLALGKTVVVPNHTGFTSYCDSNNAYMIPSKMVPANNRGLLQYIYEGADWFEPDREEASALIHKAIKTPFDPKAINQSVDYLTWDATVTSIMNNLQNLRTEHPRSKLHPSKELKHITFVCKSWNTSCGIAEYSKELVSHLGNYTTGVMGGSATVYSNLFRNMVMPDKPHIAHIMHEYQFFAPARLYNLIQSMRQYDVPVIITQHTLAHVPAHNDIIKEADGIIVHSEFSKQYAVDQLGYNPSRVFVIPMGCGPVISDDKDPIDFTLGFFGFCYHHKGLHKLIKSFSELQTKYPKLKLKIIASKPKQDSQGYFEYCSQLFRELNTKQAEWIQEYKTNAEVLKHIKQTTMMVLPYDDYGSVGTSAAVRMCFRALRPVLVSNTCWFSELDHFIAPRIDNNDLTGSIERFLSGYSFDLWKKTIAQYAHDTSWDRVVQKHKELYDQFK